MHDRKIHGQPQRRLGPKKLSQHKTYHFEYIYIKYGMQTLLSWWLLMIEYVPNSNQLQKIVVLPSHVTLVFTQHGVCPTIQKRANLPKASLGFSE